VWDRARVVFRHHPDSTTARKKRTSPALPMSGLDQIRKLTHQLWTMDLLCRISFALKRRDDVPRPARLPRPRQLKRAFQGSHSAIHAVRRITERRMTRAIVNGFRFQADPLPHAILPYGANESWLAPPTNKKPPSRATKRSPARSGECSTAGQDWRAWAGGQIKRANTTNTMSVRFVPLPKLTGGTGKNPVPSWFAVSFGWRSTVRRT
jgi:hypothetical protein